MSPTIPNVTPDDQNLVETHLKSEFESNQILTNASKLLGFLSSLESIYSNTWSDKETWDSPTVTPTLALGGISFSSLTEPTSPRILVHSVGKILVDQWDTIAALKPLTDAGADFSRALSFAKELKKANTAHDAANHLKALIATLNPASEEKEQAEDELPFALKNEFFTTLRPEGILQEKEWNKLSLADLRTKLDEKHATLTKQKNDNTARWTDEDESILKELTDLREKHDAWLVTWKDARKNLVENRLNTFTFPGIDKVDTNLFLKVFLEHTPEAFSPQDDSKVVEAVTAYWKDLVSRKVPTGDPGFYFRSSVLAAYDAYNKALKQLTADHASQAASLQAQIAKALNLEVSEDEKITAEDGGGAAADETDTTTVTPPDADLLSRQQNRWAQQLKRLNTLQQDLKGIPDPTTNATVVGSLRGFAEKLGIPGTLKTIDDIVVSLNESWAIWAESLSGEQITSRLDEFDDLLQASEQILAQTKTQPDTPGEAARKAQEAREEAAATQAGATPTSDQASELDQLKDLSKLHHSHAALVAMALAQLEIELKERGYSEAEILAYLNANQPALAQYLWTQYLSQLQGTATTPLSSSDVFRLALSSSLFFVDKFELEKGVRTTPLGPDSLRHAQTGELPPELQARLLAIAKAHGYKDPEELFAALFGNGDRATSLAEFIRRAEYAASLSPREIERISRAQVQQFLGKNGSDGLLERLMASLERDQYTLEQFFNLDPSTLSREQKLKWRELSELLLRQQKNQVLNETEHQKLTQLLTELAPILELYVALGPAFFTLRQGDSFRQFLSEASRFGQMEAELEQQSGQTKPYVPLIPRQFYTAGSPVMTMRRRTEIIEISITKQTKQPRYNLALEAMVALSLAEQGTAEYEAAYMAMVQAQLAEAGIPYSPGNLAATQSQSARNWSSRTLQQTGGGDGGAVSQLTAQFAGAGKSPAAGKAALTGLKGVTNLPKLILMTKVAVAGTGGFILGYGVYKVIEPFLRAANFLGIGGGSSATAAASPLTLASSAISSPAAAAVSSSVADGSSNVAINAKSIASEQLSKATTVANTSGTMVKTAMTAITTTAVVAPAIVAAGILGPMIGMLLLTVIVWSVIGNSLNDYGGLGVARRGLGIEGCWPTTGTITQLDTPAHKTDKTRGGTALDIGAGELTEIYTPFAGRAKAFAENPSPDPMENNGGYGNYVRVYTNLGFDLIFAHMKAIELPDGEQLVVAGQMIGGVGTTGNSDGNHLHYEMWDIQGLGMRITDVTPVPASEITIGLAVSAYECGTPRAATSPSPSTSPSPTPATIIPPASTPPTIDPSQLGDLTIPLPTTPPENL